MDQAMIRRDEVLEALSQEEWSQRAFLFCSNYLRRTQRGKFTGEQMRHWISHHKHAGIGAPPKPELMGALINTLARKNIIQRAGYSNMKDIQSHGRETPLWSFV